MLYRQPVTPQLMKKINRAWVIDILTKRGPISQTQICELTGLSRATISTIITDLREEDLVIEVKRAKSISGRRQVLLELNADAGYVVGIDLGGTKMIGAVTNFRGEVISELHRPTNAAKGPEATYENLLEFIQDLVEHAGIPKSKVSGVGIGVPGVVVEDNSVVQWAPALNWRDFPLAKKLSKQLDYPVFIENDVNLQALGEYWYGSGQGVDVLVSLAIGTGLGAGIILNGQLFTGSHQAAGEVCNLVSDVSQLGQDYPGFGFLESRASGTGVSQRYAELSSSKEKVSAEQVFAKAREGDPCALEVMEDFTKNLAMSIVSISTVLDPELIILGGGVSREAELFLPRLKELALPVLQVAPQIEVSQLGSKAGVMGAIALTLHNTNEDPLKVVK